MCLPASDSDLGPSPGGHGWQEGKVPHQEYEPSAVRIVLGCGLRRPRAQRCGEWWLRARLWVQDTRGLRQACQGGQPASGVVVVIMHVPLVCVSYASLACLFEVSHVCLLGVSLECVSWGCLLGASHASLVCAICAVHRRVQGSRRRGDQTHGRAHEEADGHQAEGNV